MNKAKLTYVITMKYTTEVEKYDEDYTLDQEIALQTEYLQNQGEDLHEALINSELISVELSSVKKFDQHG